MNKKILTLTSTLLLLSGCAKQITVEIPTVTNELTTTKFDYTKGYNIKNDLMVYYKDFYRNDEVLVTDEDDTYYYIDDKHIILAINKDFIRLEDEDKFEEYDAFTRAGSKLYNNYNLDEALQTFKLNDEVKVVDSFAGLLLVEYNDQLGYMQTSQVSKTKIVLPKPKPVVTTPTPDAGGGGSSSSDSGGGGGSYSPPPAPDPAPAPDPGPSSGDGQDIQLSYTNDSKIVFLSLNKNGRVLADNIKAYITKLNLNDEIDIFETNENTTSILIDGRLGQIDTKYVRENDFQYESFNVFTKNNTGACSDYELSNIIKTFKLNDEVKVIDELDSRYLVELEDGTIGYMLKTNTSKTKIVIVKPKPVVTTPTPDTGGSSSSSDSGGGGSYSPPPASDPAPAPEPEWTEPAL